MAHDADALTPDAAGSGDALPDLSSLTAAAIMASRDTVLDHALRRLADELGRGAPILAAFGNFAPPGPDPN